MSRCQRNATRISPAHTAQTALNRLRIVLPVMRLDFFRLLEPLRSSYWFIPSVMTISAVLLGIGVIWLDAGPTSDWLSHIGWYQQAKPEGARQVLSTIAGSMITVAGVVFSITIVAIAYAASQYGPRILTNLAIRLRSAPSSPLSFIAS